MPSVSYRRWRTDRAAVLDAVEGAHASAQSSTGGRRAALHQVSRGYAVLLSAEFQGFCKDLHRECIEHLLTAVPATLHDIVRKQFLASRLLDRGNPNPGNIGSDFARFGIKFWEQVTKAKPGTSRWQQRLEMLNQWRNAIAHDDYDPGKLGGTVILRVADVRSWRTACGRLAKVFDAVLFAYLRTAIGTPPW